MRCQHVNSLFDAWDSDHSGYLDLEELHPVLGKWRGFDGKEQGGHVCMCVCVCVCVCMRARARARVRACMRGCGCVRVCACVRVCMRVCVILPLYVMHTLKYPSSQHLSSGTTAKEKLASQRTQQKRLTRPQFHSYMNQLTTGMEPSEVEEFIDYLSTSVKVRLLPQVHPLAYTQH